jgi:hypothetical protein
MPWWETWGWTEPQAQYGDSAKRPELRMGWPPLSNAFPAYLEDFPGYSRSSSFIQY